MGSSQELVSDSSKISVNPEEQSGFYTSPDPHADPAQDNSSEEYTDSDDDPNPGLAAGGCFTVDFETAKPIVVEKAREGIQIAIDDFNRKNNNREEEADMLKGGAFTFFNSVWCCAGYQVRACGDSGGGQNRMLLACVYLSFCAVDSVDNLLTEFEAYVVFDPLSHKLKSVECEAKSTKRGSNEVNDNSLSKRQRGM